MMLKVMEIKVADLKAEVAEINKIKTNTLSESRHLVKEIAGFLLAFIVN